MVQAFGGQSMVGDLLDVLVKKQTEHKELREILSQNGAKIHNHFESMDPVLITDAGAVILRFAKPLRQMLELQIPILGEIREPGLVEGGDLLWLDDRTLLAGRGYRTNLSGILQLRDLLQKQAIAVMPFDLPHNQGPECCLHLQSLISLVDVDLALVYAPLMPASLMEFLKDRKFQVIEVTEEEFKNTGTNIVTIKPRVVLMLDRCPSLKRRLEERDIQVFTFKAEAGPSSLIRPLRRAKVRDRYGDGNIYG